MWNCWLLVIIIFISFSTSLISQSKDYSRKTDIEINVEEEDANKYSIILSEKNEITCLSDNPKDKTFYLVEDYFYNINSIQVKTKNSNQKKYDLPSFKPEREDIFISDDKVYYFSTPSGMKLNDKITYEYEVEFSDAGFFTPIYLDNSFRYESFEIIVNHPPEIKPEFIISSDFQKITPQIKFVDEDETSFEIKNIEPIAGYDYYPLDQRQLSIYILFKKNSSTINKTTPTEFVNWYAGLTDIHPSLDMKDKGFLSKEISEVDNNLEKLKIIYDYIRENFRYIAEEQASNSIIPRSPSIVQKKGYADCKERAALLSAIAKEYGIKVNMVLVTKAGIPETDIIYIDKFNHVICSYDSERQTMFFDPTSRYCEFGNLPESDIGAKALILDEINPRLVVIEPPVQYPSIVMDVRVSLDSLNKGIAKIVLHNDHFFAAMHAKKELTGDKLENFLSAIILSYLYKISFDYFLLVEEHENSLTFDAMADLSGFIISSSTKKYIPQTPFLFLNNDIFERESDSLGIFLDERTQLKLNIIIDSGDFVMQNDSVIISESYTNTFFSATGTQLSNGNLNLNYHLNQSLKFLERKDKTYFLDFYKNYLNTKTKMFILKAKQ